MPAGISGRSASAGAAAPTTASPGRYGSPACWPRRRAAHPGPREDCKRYRPSGARVILQAASRGGRRLRLRYLGAVKDNAWLKHRADAVAVWYAAGRIAHDQACRARARRVRRVFA